MKVLLYLPLVALLAMAGCSRGADRTAEVEESVRTSLDQAGLRDVSIDHDEANRVFRLTGEVPSEADKMHAEQIAKTAAGDQTVANEILVTPPGQEGAAEEVHSELDAGIENNLKAALTQKRLDDQVSYEVRNGVVTLKGEVDSRQERMQAEETAKSVPNVQQVVNTLEVKESAAATR